MMRKQLPQLIVLLLLLTITFRSATAQGYQTLPPTNGDGTLRRLRVPILMYHYVSELPTDADAIRVGLTVSPQMFRNHIEYLYAQGYSTVSLYEIHLALEYGIPLPPRPVVLSFDDGHLDHYNNVFPLLRQHGFTGTFFIVSQFADTNRPGYMSWQHIAEMANTGMSMESHTKTHADLRERNYDFLVFEILGSVESIASHTGIEPRMFAYPVGRYDINTLAVLNSTRVLRAVTTETGTYITTDNRLLLPRMRVTNETTISGLQYLLDYRE